MPIADQIYELVKSLPQEQASEVLTFAEFVRSRYLSEQQPRLLEAPLTWPELVQALAGSWGSDFPTLEEVRFNPGHDIPRESF